MTAPSRDAAASALKWKASQQLAVKLLFLVRTPILARLLAPDDFGLLAIGLVSLDILMRITDVGMVPALIQKEGAERRHYDAAWSVGVVRSSVVALCVFLAAPFIAAAFGEVRATPVIQVLGARPLLMSLASIGVAELTRALHFRKITILRLSDVGVDAALSIGLAPFLGVWALVIGSLAGPFVYTTLSYVLAPYRPRISLEKSATSSLIRFGRWIFLSGLVNLASNLVLQGVISRQLGTAELGIYYLAVKIAGTLSEVSYELVGSVAFPWFSRMQQDRRQARRMFQGLLRGMAVVLIPTGLMLAALAPSIVEDLLGPQWIGAEHVIRVMVVAMLFGAFGDAAVPVLRSLGRPNHVTALDAIRGTTLIVLVFEGADRFGLVGAAGAWIPATIITQLFVVLMIRRTFEAPFHGLLKLTAVILAISLAGCAAAVGVEAAVPGILGLLAGALAGGAVILTLLVMTDRYWSLEILEGVATLSPRVGGLMRRFGFLDVRRAD